MSDDVKGWTVTVRFSAGDLVVLDEARGGESLGRFVKRVALVAAGLEKQEAAVGAPGGGSYEIRRRCVT